MRLPIRNRLKEFRAIGLTLLTGATLSAADAAHPGAAATAMQDSIARQRQAVVSMGASLEAQRRSVQTQLGGMQARSFFRPLPVRPPADVPGAAMPVWHPKPDCPPLAASELEALIEPAAEQQDLDPELLRSVIRQESAARPCAVSAKGAMGLMQLMPSTALQLGVGDAFDPKENVEGGARLLKQLLQLYGGDLSLALGAFNAGLGRVNQAGGLPNYPETLDYVQKVLSFLPQTH